MFVTVITITSNLFLGVVSTYSIAYVKKKLQDNGVIERDYEAISSILKNV